MDILKSWFEDHRLFLYVLIAALLFLISWDKKHRERLQELIVDIISSAGDAILDIVSSASGVLKAIEDFFEALLYMLFGNFSSGIRFIVANYTILFASIVSFFTTFWGLNRILHSGLALALSFAIQTALLLMALCTFQMCCGEPVKWKKDIFYYRQPEGQSKPEDMNFSSVASMSESTSPEECPNHENEGAGKAVKGHGIRRFFSKLLRKWIPGLCCGAITLGLAALSSVLTYVYLYDQKLESYVLYKASYDLINQVTEDTAENIEKLQTYFNDSYGTLQALREWASKNEELRNKLEQIIKYLDGSEETASENSASLLANFDSYINEHADLFTEEGTDTIKPLTDWESPFPPMNSAVDWKNLAKNAVMLKEYPGNLIKSAMMPQEDQPNGLMSIKTQLEDLRDYLIETEAVWEIKAVADIHGNEEETKKDAREDRKKLRQKIYEVIEMENELYGSLPELQPLKIWTESEGKAANWLPPVSWDFASKYNCYLEITEERFLPAGRAFGALSLNWKNHNLFLWVMFGLCFSADAIIIFACFLRTRQEAGENNQEKRNLLHSIFICQPSEEEQEGTDRFFLFALLIGIAAVYLIMTVKPTGWIETNNWRLACVLAVALVGYIVSLFIGAHRLLRKKPAGDKQEDTVQLLWQLLSARSFCLLEKASKPLLRKEIHIRWLQPEKNTELQENLPVRCRHKLIEKPVETCICQELFFDCKAIAEIHFMPEMHLLCAEGLAYPVRTAEKTEETIGYVLTNECINLLIKELFKEAREKGLDTQRFKEDLKEYEEKTWD